MCVSISERKTYKLQLKASAIDGIEIDRISVKNLLHSDKSAS